MKIQTYFSRQSYQDFIKQTSIDHDIDIDMVDDAYIRSKNMSEFYKALWNIEQTWGINRS